MRTTRSNDRTTIVDEIMRDFAERTGLEGGKVPPRRYLWTDAFAVCNFLELFDRTGSRSFLHLATKLVNQVHHVLGRHREDDSREGWISGLDEEEGERHPTCGGLRIGKDDNERSVGEPFDERREWNRDGQYYHYLTKWMHALDRVAQVTGEQHYHGWAVELAKAGHSAFVRTGPQEEPRMFWKVSIDLSRPLVPRMGHHDPLDGLITYWQLQTGEEDGDEAKAGALGPEIAQLAAFSAGQSWATTDALGIGGLLTDAFRFAQLLTVTPRPDPDLLPAILGDALRSLEFWEAGRPLEQGLEGRLAFRELGLSIGLHAVERLQEFAARHSGTPAGSSAVRSVLEPLGRYTALANRIDADWLDESTWRYAGWSEHRDINSVMLATAIGPDSYLRLEHPSSSSSPQNNQLTKQR